ELGHIYAEDFGPGNVYLRRHFERIRPWVTAAHETCRMEQSGGSRPRISHCFLIDDYFNRFGDPSEVIDTIRKVAAEFDLPVDYIAREAGCARADDVAIAESMLARLVSDPTPGTTGGRPPVTESGWLCNGQRSPAMATPHAMKEAETWRPPTENGVFQHSIFVDVQLFSDEAGKRTYSCAFLASVWQLNRLGLLRHTGEVAVRPYLIGKDEMIPNDWDKLPAILQFESSSAPFAAYRTLSLLHSRFLTIEHGVRTILGQVAIDPTVNDQVRARAAKERMPDLPVQPAERMDYMFING
ncbi:MAG TPA: SCO2522 family protein, partial [Micromonosporaceae bacterium]